MLGLLPETALTRGAVVLRSRDGSSTADVVTLSGREMREVRGKRIAMILQDPMASLNLLFTIGDQVGERAAGRRVSLHRGAISLAPG